MLSGMAFFDASRTNSMESSNVSLLDSNGQILCANELVPWTGVQGWESSHVKHF